MILGAMNTLLSKRKTKQNCKCGNSSENCIDLLLISKYLV